MSDPVPQFGDFLRAFARLRPSGDEAKRALANLFGLDYEAETEEEPEPPTGGADESEDDASVQTPASVPTRRDAPFVSGKHEINTDVRPSVLRPLANETAPPQWGLAKPLELPPPKRAEPPPLEPLLVPRWTRGILSAALARRAAEGEIDVEALVQTIGTARPFRAVPRRLVSRSGGGVQVLVDASETMTPFAEDARWLTRRIEVVAGRDRTDILGIDYTKKFVAGAGMRLDWTDYFQDHAPIPGIAVFLVSDLGIGRAPLARWISPQRWLSFATRLRKRGVPLIALVPYAKERWPPELRRVIPIVHWDARTTARSARRAVETRLRQQGRRGP